MNAALRRFGLLLTIEMRRAMARRAVWVLIALALLLITVTGVVAFVASNDFDSAAPGPNIARVTDLWPEGGGDGVLGATMIFLVVGALIGGSTITGAEWQHGTVVAVCTWEVRRGLLLMARILSAGLLAFVIGFGLLVLLCLVLAPTYLLRGSTDGADSAFWGEVLGAMGRMAAVGALGATTGAAVASIGRRTAVAIGAAFAYLAILEGAVRGFWPERARWLIGENAAIVLTAANLDDAAFTRSVATAAVTLCGYALALGVVAVLLFRRRDLAGMS